MQDDAEFLAALIGRIASATTTFGDAEYLRDCLISWLNVIVARGEALGYENADDDQLILDALEEMRL